MNNLMSQLAEKNTNALELIYTIHPSVKRAILLALHLWVCHQVQPGDLESAAPDTINKAYHGALAASRNNAPDIRLRMLVIFLSIESGRLDLANEMLDRAMGISNYIKNNEPVLYGVLCFLYTYLEIKQKRIKSAKKYIRMLHEFEGNINIPTYQLINGVVAMASMEYSEAYQHLANAYAGGCRSMFLYVYLYNYYKLATPNPEGGYYGLIPVLKWALARGADISEILGLHKEATFRELNTFPFLAENLYHIYNNGFILENICINLIASNDYSPRAFEFYLEAERKQIMIVDLHYFIVKSSWLNKADRISHYAMGEFLRGGHDFGDGDDSIDFKSYVYHMVLISPALHEYIEGLHNDIMQLSIYCLENDISGCEANSLYYYYWGQCVKMGINDHLSKKALNTLLPDVTHYMLSAPYESDTRFVCVNEKEKKGIDIYEMVLDAKSNTYQAIISAASDGFTYTCLNAGQKNIVNESLKCRPLVQSSDPALHWFLFQGGSRSFPVVIYLSNILIEDANEISDDDIPYAIEVLEEAVKNKDIAKPYEMRIRVALGGLFYKSGDFAKALEYYDGVRENEPNGPYLGQILNVYIETGEWERAAGLIMRKKRLIDNDILQKSLKIMASQQAYQKNIAGAAYGLLVNGNYDKELLDIAILLYDGGRLEWEDLSQVLAASNIASPELDEKIIHNSIWSHELSEAAQKAFVRFVRDKPEGHPAIWSFVQFLIYEILTKGAKLEYEIINLLEKYLLSQAIIDNEENDFWLNMLAWSLCHIYLRENITTFNSDSVWENALRAMEDKETMFPIFREMRNHHEKHPYIKKMQPFMYKDIPGKNILLYYKFDDEPVYNNKKMDYIRFGIYLTCLPIFFGEKIIYYFSDEIPTGSITTQEAEISCETVYINDTSGDDFFLLNNAVIYERMFKYDKVEQIISGLVKEPKQIRGKLM